MRPRLAAGFGIPLPLLRMGVPSPTHTPATNTIPHLFTVQSSPIFVIVLTILDLCSGSGAWSEPYARAGYDVRSFDLSSGSDVRLLTYIGPVHGILAAPPCTHFASSGARWWAEKGEEALLEGLAVVDACLRAVAMHRPVWWALENPIGRLRLYLGPPAFAFDPCDFGDPYTKRTLLWGQFTLPEQTPVEPADGSRIHVMSPSPDRAQKRSITPPGFTKAFFEANP